MPIPRYKQQTIRPQTGGGTAALAQAKGLDSALGIIGKFQEMSYGIAVSDAKEEARIKALKDAELGQIDKDSVAYVAKDTYMQTAQTAYMSNLKIKSNEYANNIKMEQDMSQNYDSSKFKAQWESYSKNIISEIDDPELKYIAKRDLEVTGVGYSSNIRKSEIKLDRSRKASSINAAIELEAQNVDKLYGLDNELAMESMNKINGMIQTSIDAGFINEDEGELKKRSIMKGAYKSDVLRGLDHAIETKSTSKFLKEFKKKDHSGMLTINEEMSLKNSMQKQVNAQKSAYSKQYTMQVNDGIKILKSGKLPENINNLQKMTGALTPAKQLEFKRAQEAQKIYTTIDAMPLNDLEAHTNKLEAQKEMNIKEYETLEMLQTMVKEKRTLAKRDPITLAAQDGFLDEITPVTTGNIGPLEDRVDKTDFISKQYGVEKKILTETEENEFTTWANSPNTTISEKIEKIEEIDNTIGEESETLYKQISKKGAGNFSMAGMLIGRGQKETAKDIFKGQLILKEYKGGVPKDVTAVIPEELGNVFSHTEVNTRKNFNSAIMSVFAAKAERNGTLGTDDVDTDDMEEAINEVTGGIFEYNDKKILSPRPGVTEDDFEEWIDDPGEITPPLNITLSEFKDALEESELETMGQGKYAVKYNGKYFKAEDGSKYILEYK